MAITAIDYTSDRLAQNVQDEFKNMTPEQVREATANGRTPLVNVCMNLTSDFNKSSIIRASNAMLCRETIMVGAKKFDRRGTVGTHHFEVVKHADNLAEVVDYLHAEGYTVFAVDNTPELNPESVYEADIPEKSAFVYGEEQRGLSVEEAALCDGAVYLPQRGVVRSLNVAQAAAVMMAEYVRRHGI